MKKIHSYRSAHQGFTLLELGVAMFVLSAILVASTITLSIYHKRMQAQLVGQQYQSINAAVGKYLKLYFLQLIDVDNACSTLSMGVGTVPTEPGIIATGGCSKTFTNVFKTTSTVVVANALQPTLDELKNLSLIEPTTVSQLQLQTENIVMKTGGILAPRVLAIQINKTCAPTGCGAGAKLDSLVFNAQPFVMGSQASRFNFDLEEELLVAGGADAAMANPGIPAGSSYELKGDLFTSPNPIRNYAASGSVGIRGIMAIRNSYDAATDSDYARRDGTSTITGDWNFNDHNITGVDYLQAKSIYASGTLNANKFAAMRIKLPAITPLTGCDMATQSLGVEQATGEIFICRVNGGGYGNPAEGTGWWKGVSSSSP